MHALPVISYVAGIVKWTKESMETASAQNLESLYRVQKFPPHV